MERRVKEHLLPLTYLESTSSNFCESIQVLLQDTIQHLITSMRRSYEAVIGAERIHDKKEH